MDAHLIAVTEILKDRSSVFHSMHVAILPRVATGAAACAWFIENVWPRIRETAPDRKLDDFRVDYTKMDSVPISPMGRL